MKSASGRRRLGTVMVVAAIGATLVAIWPASNASPASPSAKQDSIVLVASSSDAADVAASAGARPDAIWRSALHGFSADLSADQITTLRADARVLSVTSNRTWRPGTSVVPVFSPAGQSLPTGIERIGGARSITADIDKRDDVRIKEDIAIIDSGIQTDHPDLNVVGGVDCTGSGPFDDGYGHGTAVAGVAGAIDNKIGVVGVAPGVRLWSVRVSDVNGVLSDQTLICGMNWVTAHASVIDVANISLENEWRDRGSNCRTPRGDAILAATCGMTDAGVTTVVAAGNDSADASGFQPAGFPNVITASGLADYDGKPGGDKAKPTCAAFGPDDGLASFSNFGATIDIAAPSTCLGVTYLNSGYVQWFGTSFASPHVAGAAALYLSTHPGATPDQVRAALLAAAEPGPIRGDPDPYPEPVLNVSGF
jgi:subtilisin